MLRLFELDSYFGSRKSQQVGKEALFKLQGVHLRLIDGVAQILKFSDIFCLRLRTTLCFHSCFAQVYLLF